MLEKNLQNFFGFTTFKRGQRKVIERILRHQSAGAIFPTGAGKSLCYQLPAMLLPGMTLVVSPLLSLMKDQIDFLTKHKIPAARLDSTLSQEEYMHIIEQAKCGKLKILMIAVERFKNERFRHHLKQMKVSFMAVDEAHCISEWGHNFRPEYLKLPAYQKEFQIPQALLLTATATKQVRDDMCGKFNIAPEHVTVTGFYRQNLFLQVTSTQEAFKKQNLLDRLKKNTKAPTIVYVTLQKTAEEVARFLNANQINAAHYHAGMSNDERENIQNLFMDGKLDCVAATIAFGMGIDKRDLRRVIHYDLPKSIENYSQEIGRSGRDGLPSFCEVLANRDNITILENFIYGDTPESTSIFKLLEKIQHHEKPLWETKLFTLSNEVDIRLLPLKTLFVYLDMEGIIRPKYTYFEEYSFKYYDSPEQIIERFEGERKEFLRVLFSRCTPKTIWNYLDMAAILRDYKTERSRVVAALEYFAEKKWIELRAQKSTETYDILTRSFDLDQMTDKIFKMFSDKESHEIRRIQEMIAFFESPTCLNKKLASYFGENLDFPACGHCSVCKQGESRIQQTVDLPPLVGMDFYELSRDFLNAADKDASVINLTKFLCGIYTPLFRKLKVNTLPHFGVLHRYAFQDVKQWVTKEKTLKCGDAAQEITKLTPLTDSKDIKTFVVLAASRKYGGYCIAGKEWSDGRIGPWVRPVSRRINGELTAEEVRMNNEKIPGCMDIVEVETHGPARHAYQKENFFSAEKQTWMWQWKLPDATLAKLLDHPDNLWLDGSSSTSGLNDRVPEEIVVKNDTPSLYLIRPDDFMILVSDDLYGRKKVNARFTYRKTPYLLSVTDMTLEREYLMKPQDEYPLDNKNIYLTISLGEPFNGFCYKLVAAVMIQNKD